MDHTPGLISSDDRKETPIWVPKYLSVSLDWTKRTKAKQLTLDRLQMRGTAGDAGGWRKRPWLAQVLGIHYLRLRGTRKLQKEISIQLGWQEVPSPSSDSHPTHPTYRNNFFSLWSYKFFISHCMSNMSNFLVEIWKVSRDEKFPVIRVPRARIVHISVTNASILVPSTK